MKLSVRRALLAASSLVLIIPGAAIARPDRDGDDDRRSSHVRHHAPTQRRDDDRDDDDEKQSAPPTLAPAAPTASVPSSRPAPTRPLPGPTAPALASPGPIVRSEPGSNRDDEDDDDEQRAPQSAIVVTAHRLDVAREDVEPSIGASRYSLTNDAVEARPGGETTTIADVLQQAPGVSDAGSGDLIVRGARGAVQYRVNNVIIPDPTGEIGERLSSRVAARIDLLTGALPAQFGLNGGSIVNITMKSGAYLKGGQAELYGGSHGEFEPAVEFAGSHGDTSGFVTGSYLTSNAGLPAPDQRAHPTHDVTRQIEGIGYLDQVINDTSRLSLIAGASHERFDLPTLGGPSVNPAALNRRAQNSRFGAATYLSTSGATTLQASLYGRQSTDRLNGPDAIRLRDKAGGVQVEAVIALGRHKLRVGSVISGEGEARDAAPYLRRGTQTLFVQDEWSVTKQLTVNGGLRFDRVGGQGGGNALAPRLGLVWAGADGLTVHAGYARYLVPAALEQRSADPKDNARSERDDYWDVGAQKIVGAMTLGLDVYRRRARDMLGNRAILPAPHEQQFNYASGTIRGVEASFLYARGPASAWASAAFSHGKGRGLTGGEDYFTIAERAYLAAHSVTLADTQAFTASAGGSYRLGKLRLSADALCGSGLPEVGTFAGSDGHLPAYVRFDAAAVLRLSGLSGKGLDLRLDVVNLFDRRYQIQPGEARSLPQYGASRGVFVGLEQGF